MPGASSPGSGSGRRCRRSLRGVAPLAPADQRGALLSATYILVYLSFSVPAVIGGAAVSVVGLSAAIIGYGLVVMALAALSAIAISRRLATVEGASS